MLRRTTSGRPSSARSIAAHSSGSTYWRMTECHTTIELAVAGGGERLGQPLRAGPRRHRDGIARGHRQGGPHPIDPVQLVGPDVGEQRELVVGPAWGRAGPGRSPPGRRCAAPRRRRRGRSAAAAPTGRRSAAASPDRPARDRPPRRSSDRPAGSDRRWRPTSSRRIGRRWRSVSHSRPANSTAERPGSLVWTVRRRRCLHLIEVLGDRRPGRPARPRRAADRRPRSGRRRPAPEPARRGPGSAARPSGAAAAPTPAARGCPRTVAPRRPPRRCRRPPRASA